MNALFLSFFLVLLAVLGVQSEEGEECGLAKIKCRKNQFCYRNSRLKLDIDLGVCLPYLRKGAVCTDDLLCRPELECKEVDSPFFKFRTCQEPSSKPTDDGISTVPEESTVITESSDAPEPETPEPETPEPEIPEETPEPETPEETPEPETPEETPEPETPENES